METIRTNIAGSWYYRDEYEKVQTGDVVYLVKEPTNQYDKDAIQVLNADGKPIGHVTNSPKTCRPGSKRATELQPTFQDRLKAVIYDKDDKNCYIMANPSNMGFLQRLRKDLSVSDSYRI